MHCSRGSPIACRTCSISRYTPFTTWDLIQSAITAYPGQEDLSGRKRLLGDVIGGDVEREPMEAN